MFHIFHHVYIIIVDGFSASIVSEEHFGGFLTKKKEVEGQKKSWKEKMEEIIATSKRAKVSVHLTLFLRY